MANLKMPKQINEKSTFQIWTEIANFLYWLHNKRDLVYFNELDLQIKTFATAGIL